MGVRLRSQMLGSVPTVLNNPRDSKHETIPTDVFMPGKNGRVPKDNRSLQSLVRLLHGTHRHLFGRAIQTDGFRLGACGGQSLLHAYPQSTPPSVTVTFRISCFPFSLIPIVLRLESYTLLAPIMMYVLVLKYKTLLSERSTLLLMTKTALPTVLIMEHTNHSGATDTSDPLTLLPMVLRT